MIETPENNNEKMFYTIGEVAEMFGENTSLIRFWSNTFGEIIHPQKNKKGNRLFSPDDVETFKLIYFLVRNRGMKLAGVKKRILQNRDGSIKNMQAIQSLEKIKKFLLEIKETL